MSSSTSTNRGLGASLPRHIGRSEVFRLGWPIIVSMLSHTAMALADTIFLGQLGTAPVAAIGLALTCLWVVQAFGNHVLGGVKITVAQATGADDAPLGRRLAWQGLWLAGLIGLVGASLSPAAEPMFALFGASDEVTRQAATAFAIQVLGAPLLFVMTALTGYFQGQGDTRLPMRATILANGVNLALDPLFIFGAGPIPDMGIAGASLATVLGCAAGAVFLLYHAWGSLVGTSKRPDRKLLAWIWRVGGPLGLRAALEVGAFAVFAAMLARAGDDQLAAHVIVLRIISVSFLPGYGLGDAAAVLVGMAIGAGRHELVGETFRAALTLGLAFMGGWAVVFVVIPDVLLAPFDPAPEVASIARNLLLVAAGFQLFDAIAMIAQGVLSGAEDTRFVMLTSVLAAWFVMLPAAYLLAVTADLGATGAWLGLTFELVAVAWASVWRVRSGRWR